MANEIVRHSVAETQFGFFSSAELRALSVKQVTSAVTFDSLNHPVPNGVYDRALGPTDTDAVCPTCHQIQPDCPGHLGHIELSVQVYNPLLFPLMYKVLRAKCLHCHRFRMAADKVARYVTKLNLAMRGNVGGAEGLDDSLLAKGGEVEDKEEAQDRRERVVARAAAWIERHEPLRSPGPRVRGLRRKLLAAFLADAPKKCENCKALSPELRKDGFVKIFIKPLSKKNKKANAAQRIKIESALAVEDPTADLMVGGEGGDDGDDDDDDDDSDEEGGENSQGSTFMPPLEVAKQMELLWSHESALLNILVDGAAEQGHSILFMNVVPVPPSRFRPPAVMAGMTFEHPQNVYLTKILQLNERLTLQDEMSRKRRAEADGGGEGEGEGESKEAHGGHQHVNMQSIMQAWNELQHMVNCLFDSGKDKSATEMPAGIRQVLERKEGLFRKHMMGKRVNFACRSVLSPDPYIGTDEIGLPLRFATQLTYPEPVTPWNVQQLRRQVINGPSVHPGANYVENERGQKLDLSKMDETQRRACARTLLTRSSGASGGRVGKRVYRHLHTGDVVLVNRQPTLHKPGIMAHKVRVMSNPSNQTIRMHYANCNTYNADFDGDEINVHFPQSELARAEAYHIASNDLQYVVPTDGSPIRGLIQDHVDAGVKLTKRDTFVTRDVYYQLLFAACNSMDGIDVVEGSIEPLEPAILKPQRLWTGKQVVSSLLAQLCRGKVPLNLDGKTRTPHTAFGKDTQEHQVLFREGELLRGVLDKAQFGASSYGLVHACHELYGPRLAGQLLTSLGRLFTCYLQFAGHTCGMEDLVLTPSAEARRQELIGDARVQAEQALVEFLKLDSSIAKLDAPLAGDDALRVRETLSVMLRGNAKKESHAALDGHLQSALAPAHSDIIKACLPGGQRVPFPRNNFSLMVLTGAKGGMVNHSQISCGLGQQALEGRRVPVMVSGKTLPCFAAFDPDPRASGYIADRFLTGIRPGEYYFHCMAGREGLVDTAVKTSRSGYLQRCLVKHLEDLTVGYDYTVRDGEGTVVQFMYGGDAIDPLNHAYLSGADGPMNFIARNHMALAHKLSLHENYFDSTGTDRDTANAAHTHAKRARSEQAQEDAAAGGALVLIKKGANVLARKRVSPSHSWALGGIATGWHRATVSRVHKDEHAYDLAYADGTAELAVPRRIFIARGSTAEGSGATCQGGHAMLIKRANLGPVLHDLNPAQNVGAISERLQSAIDSYVARNPSGLIAPSEEGDKKKNKKKNKKNKKQKQQEGAEEGGGEEEEAEEKKAVPGVQQMPSSSFELLLWVMSMRGLVNPGEAVGTVAAQSVGEPSTQMTLNTFHLAGHGGANVTLGIPRLREIIMTASQNMKTPNMTVPFLPEVDKTHAELLARRLSRLAVSELIHHERGIRVSETLESRNGGGTWQRTYTIRLNFHALDVIKTVFGVSFKALCQAVGLRFVTQLIRVIKKEIGHAGKSINDDKAGRSGADVAADDEAEAGGAGAGAGGKKAKAKAKSVTPDDEDDDDDDSDVDAEEQGSLKLAGRAEQEGYGEMDEEDEELHRRETRVADDEDKDADEAPAQGGGGSGGGGDDDEDFGDPAAVGGKKLKDGVKQLAISDSALACDFFERAVASREGWAEVTLSFPASDRKLLMVALAEIAAHNAVVHAADGINEAFVVQQKIGGAEKEEMCLMTAGVNFAHLWGMQDWLDVNRLVSNDIYHVGETYGIEAACQCIRTQITDVFGVYGIGVDPRHLQLLADYMTQDGSYRPLNRAGISDKSSVMQQMSFETSMTFLTQAATDGVSERMSSPSARLVMGQPVSAGTGSFDVLQPLSGF